MSDWTVLLRSRFPIDAPAYAGQPVTAEGLAELPLGTVVADPATGQIHCAYLPHRSAHRDLLVHYLDQVRFTETERTNGLRVRSNNFGYLPRNTVRRPWCSSSILSRDHPELAGLLALEAGPLEAGYEAVAPGVFDSHTAQAARVLPEWRLPGARAFTGGIVNQLASIGWHHDAGNFRGSFSAMISLRSGVSGGGLAVPELGVWLPVADGTVTYFDGQSLLHGVLPMAKLRPDGYRYTIVYFSMHQLWSCLPPAEEARHAAATRESRERKRASGTVDPAVAARVARGGDPVV